MIAFFRMAVFWNHDHISDQTKPNQTSQSGILHFVKHSVRAYQKNFQLSRSNGSWDTGSGKFKIWKMSNLGFFEKWPPEAPKKGKIQFWWVPWWFWTPMLHQKKFCPFSGPGVIKYVHAYWTAPPINHSLLSSIWYLSLSALYLSLSALPSSFILSTQNAI